jgi:phage tail-like protein
MGLLFKVNTNRFDPYKNYRFLVYFRDPSVTSPAVDVSKVEPVAAVSKISGLKRSSDVIEFRAGGNAIVVKGIGRTKYDPITLERGVTQDTSFEQWANAAQVLNKGEPRSFLAKLRRELQIDLLNEAGQPAIRYLVHRCWVSEYQALPDLDAGGNAIAIEHIKVENEGWERDALAEPDESSTTGG